MQSFHLYINNSQPDQAKAGAPEWWRVFFHERWRLHGLLGAAMILPEIEAGSEDNHLGLRTCSVDCTGASMTPIQSEMIDTCPQMLWIWGGLEM